MSQAKRQLEVNMTEGAIFSKIVKFSLPLIFSNVLQLLFNVMDVLTLGIFVSDGAVAAVGATSALINLIVGLFVGLSVGANYMVADYLGKNDSERVKKTIGMSMIISVVVGVFLLIVGVIFSRTFLVLMDCDAEVLDMATSYLIIYFLGAPFMMIYNFASAILRAAGETKKPLVYLIIGGVINVILNIFFILVVGLDVEGVAIATIVSQAISGFLCVLTLIKADGVVSLRKKFVKIYKDELLTMLKIGIPSGLQGCLFALSNVIIQSTINVFGADAMAGNSYGQQIEGVVYQAMFGVSLCAFSFVSANNGAGKMDRVKKVTLECVAIVAVVGGCLGGLSAIFSKNLVGVITSDAEVIAVASKRLTILCGTQVFCGLMEVLSYSIRGLGKSFTAMIISLFGSCLLRIIWIKVFMQFLGNNIDVVYWAYPATWAITSAIHAVTYFITLRKKKDGVKQRILEA